MDQAQEVSRSTIWRHANAHDLDAVMAIQDRVHSMLPEGLPSFENKLALFADGFLVLVQAETVVGYGICHPWTLGDIPPLDVSFAELPSEADCLFVHDVALLPAARGAGAGRAYIRQASGLARREGLNQLALVSVYDSRPIWTACGFEVKAEPSAMTKLAPYEPGACYMTAALYF